MGPAKNLLIVAKESAHSEIASEEGFVVCRERCDVAADASGVWNECKLRIVCSEMNLPRALDISPFPHLA